VNQSQAKPSAVSAVQKKTIVAVDAANVVASPYDTNPLTTLWYGYEIKDLGSEYADYVRIEQGYVSKKLLTQYTLINPKTVAVRAEKGYFFATPSEISKCRGVSAKNAIVNVVGENGNWYFGSTTDENGKVLVGFVSKTVAY